MTIRDYIVYLSEIAWLLPAIRQAKTKWFLWFLVLAILDPLTSLILSVFSWNGILQYDIGSIVGYFSLYIVEGKKFKESDYLLLVLFIITLFLISDGFLYLLIIHLFIFYKLISLTIIDVHFKEQLNISLLVLVFYELSILIKFLSYIGQIPISSAPFYLTLFFEVMIAIYFAVFRIDNPRLLISLNKKTSKN